MAHIVIPDSATEQGYAFEDLILRYYQKSGLYGVREWSGYFHGASGRWWQCDGIVENDRGRYLIEAKFFRDRPAKVNDIDPARRQDAAQDMNCTGLLYISLNGFAPDMLTWSHNSELEVHFYSWADLRADLLASLSNYSSVLLDQFDLLPTQAMSVHGTASLHYDTLTPTSLSRQFPEFVTVPDSLELWLRRMPSLPLQLAQISAGKFFYNAATEQVTLIPNCPSDLTLQEAWGIQDAISGYASRTYNAVRATAEALSKMKDGLITDVQRELHAMNWDIGTRIDDIITYFKAQYAPYEPYARSLFNPNKVDGLLRLYKQFGG